MHGQRIFAIVLRQFYLMRGSLSRVMPLFTWVAVDIVLWGFLTKYLNTVTTGFNFIPALLGAVLLWDFFIRVMQGITIAFFEDVWTRNFLNIFSTPLSISEYVTGLVLTSVATSIVGLIAMVILATFIFHLSFVVYGSMLALFLLVLFLFGIALGVLASAMVLRLGPSTEWFIWPIPALVSPFAGVLYPVATLPAWMQAIARLLPASYVFEGMREILLSGKTPITPLLVGGGLTLLYMAVAFWVFTMTYRHSVRSGLIARYSAESVS